MEERTGVGNVKLVFVSPTLSNRRIKLEVESSMNVRFLKERLCEVRELEGVSAMDITLIYLGRVLDDQVPLISILERARDIQEPVVNLMFSREGTEKVVKNVADIQNASVDVIEEQIAKEPQGSTQEDQNVEVKLRDPIRTFHQVFIPATEGHPMIVNIK